MFFDSNLTCRRCGFSNSQIARQYNSARIYGRGAYRAILGVCSRPNTGGENGGTNVWELTMYGVCALSETQIAMRMQRAACRDSLDL